MRRGERLKTWRGDGSRDYEVRSSCSASGGSDVITWRGRMAEVRMSD